VGRGLGGLERVGVDLCNYLSLSGHRVALAYYGSHDPQYQAVGDIVLVSSLENFSRTINKLEQFKPDVILGMSSGFRSIYFFKIADTLSVPFCIHESTHFDRFCNQNWAKPRKISLEEAIFEREAVCAQAYRIRHVLDHSYRFFPKYIQNQVIIFPNAVVSCSVDDVLRDSVSPIENRKQIINVGGLKKVKNIKVLLEAFREFVEEFSDWKLVVCGKGFDREEVYQNSIFEYVRNNNLSAYVQFLGNVDDMKSEYLRSSVHVVTSRDENFCMCLAEAIACGLPSIGYTESFGVSSLIESNVNGILVNHDSDSHELFLAMRSIASDSKLMKFMSDNSFSKAKMFNPENIYKHWELLFSDSVSYSRNPKMLLNEQLLIDSENPLLAKRKAKQLINTFSDSFS
jgi:glycosyltransferase involved in cell wall biosynthesis